jgi:hypothetical protein
MLRSPWHQTRPGAFHRCSVPACTRVKTAPRCVSGTELYGTPRHRMVRGQAEKCRAVQERPVSRALRKVRLLQLSARCGCSVTHALYPSWGLRRKFGEGTKRGQTLGNAFRQRVDRIALRVTAADRGHTSPVVSASCEPFRSHPRSRERY